MLATKHPTKNKTWFFSVRAKPSTQNLNPTSTLMIYGKTFRTGCLVKPDLEPYTTFTLLITARFTPYHILMEGVVELLDLHLLIRRLKGKMSVVSLVCLFFVTRLFPTRV